jgi:NAD(P)-dependent dehydrogenase (short-subunit alcohol dehydrogenase family)
MKILVVGGTGTIGQAVVDELSARHEVIVAGSKSGNLQMDITSLESIEAAYNKIGALDAVIVTAGKTFFGPLSETTQAQFSIGITSKLLGQINVVLAGLQYLNPQGSFTLTSGILNHDPILSGTNAAVANGGIEGFVKSAALELPHKMRINAISPTVVEESLPHYGPYFRGFTPVSAKTVALAYAKSVEGAQTGQIYRVGYTI